MATTEEEIRKTGKTLFDSIKGRCEDKLPHIVELEEGRLAYSLVDEEYIKESLCDCITHTLNDLAPLLPKGEKAKTRRIFNSVIDIFNKEKNRKEITGCTKSLFVK